MRIYHTIQISGRKDQVLREQELLTHCEKDEAGDQRMAGEMEEISRNVSFCIVQPQQKTGETEKHATNKKTKIIEVS